MCNLKKSALLIATMALIFVPACCFSAENKILTIPLVEMLQGGKAKISSDKKSIIDDKGDIVAKQTPPPVIKEKSSDIFPTGAAKDNTTFVVNCNKKCAMITRQCYLDDLGNVVCMNVCDKEMLVCEEATK